MRGLWVLLVLLSTPCTALAESMLACTFETIPQVVLTYPADKAEPATLAVGARPPVTLAAKGNGANLPDIADLDGYRFVFTASTRSMEVQKDGKSLIIEIGRCATIGGPEDAAPLTFAGGGDAAAAIAQPVPDKGKWQVTEDKSQLDDSATVVLTLASDNTIQGQFGSPGPATLLLRCKENTTSVFLVLNDQFLSDIQGFGTVDYRIDSGKSGKVRMQSSTDNKALGLWSGGTAIPFATKLLKGAKIVLRATPFNESPQEVTFDLTGLPTAVEPLRKSCKW